jgi:NADH:ubiquinone oxidoreductase subunit 6 (subunit J)
VNTVFALSGIVAVAATVMMITRRSAVHALLYFVVSLLASAVIMFVLGAAFVAALEVIVYAGAIMVLFVFVIMLIGPETTQQLPGTGSRRGLRGGRRRGRRARSTLAGRPRCSRGRSA